MSAPLPPQIIGVVLHSYNRYHFTHISFAELARDCLNRGGKFAVEGGFISPVHDAYGKKVKNGCEKLFHQRDFRLPNFAVSEPDSCPPSTGHVQTGSEELRLDQVRK